MAEHNATGSLVGISAGISVDLPDDGIDLEAKARAENLTSTVAVDGAMITRTYSDGAVQRLVLNSPEAAQDYAKSLDGGV